MPDNREPAPSTVYQLRVVLHGVSPLIWRRLLIPADTDTTIADLHAILQIAFGWNGVHLHRFVIHGREYGIGYAGGPGFRDDPRRVRLGELGLRHTERFTYHYDLIAGWCHDLRVEQIQPHHVLAATIRVAEIGGLLLEDDFNTLAEHRDELAGLLPLLGVERFDRRKVNRDLAALAATGARAA